MKRGSETVAVDACLFRVWELLSVSDWPSLCHLYPLLVHWDHWIQNCDWTYKYNVSQRVSKGSQKGLTGDFVNRSGILSLWYILNIVSSHTKPLLISFSTIYLISRDCTDWMPHTFCHYILYKISCFPKQITTSGPLLQCKMLDHTVHCAVYCFLLVFTTCAVYTVHSTQFIALTEKLLKSIFRHVHQPIE